MAYFTPEQIARAKEIDLLTYLQNTNPEELVYEARGTFRMKSYDSLKISNGKWYRFSRCVGGKSALDYLILVEGYTFVEAVGHLINQKGIEKKHIPKQELTEKEKIDRFILPKKSLSNDRIFSYLLGRGISKSIIEECIDKGFIYQEYKRNNVVFVGFDENNFPRYAGLRGTNSSRFMGEAYGSDKAYSFQLKSDTENNDIHLFESAIDLLSYATLKEIKNEPWYEENLVSLAGVYKPAKDIFDSKVPTALSNYLKNNPNTDTIFLHFDNDEAGRVATKAIQISLSDSYKIIDEPPENGKDFNDFLCNYLGKNRKKDYENYR